MISFKMVFDVMKGNMVLWWDYILKWFGWCLFGLLLDIIVNESMVCEEFLKRFWNLIVVVVFVFILVVMFGSMIVYGLFWFNYCFGFMWNLDILFFFLS